MVASVPFWKLGRIFPSVCGSLLRKQRIESWITRTVDWSTEWTWASLFITVLVLFSSKEDVYWIGAFREVNLLDRGI